MQENMLLPQKTVCDAQHSANICSALTVQKFIRFSSHSSSTIIYISPFGKGDAAVSFYWRQALQESHPSSPWRSSAFPRQPGKGSSCIFSNHIAGPQGAAAHSFNSSDKGRIACEDEGALKEATLIKLGCSAENSSIHCLGYAC